MNEFGTIENSQGLLKNAYPSSNTQLDPLDVALKRKREKLMESKGMKDQAQVDSESVS